MMSGCGCEMEARDERERKTLIIVLCINAFMFVFELLLGLLAQSTGLIADSLDMLADATVYLISLYAVGRSAILKNRAAKFSGCAQIFLAVLVLADVLRRFILGSEPVGVLIIVVGMIALIANSITLMLISRHRDDGMHMRASLIFSKNDVIANIGVILSGLLVLMLDSRYPDLVVGCIIALIVFRGGLQIYTEAVANEKRMNDNERQYDEPSKS